MFQRSTLTDDDGPVSTYEVTSGPPTSRGRHRFDTMTRRPSTLNSTPRKEEMKLCSVRIIGERLSTGASIIDVILPHLLPYGCSEFFTPHILWFPVLSVGTPIVSDYKSSADDNASKQTNCINQNN